MSLGLRRVDVAMVDHQQESSGRDGGEQLQLGVVTLRAQQCRVLGGHQIERLRREWCVQESGVHPLDVRVGLLSVQRGALECHLRYVECGDVPALPGEPDSVGALAAPDIERPTRC